MRLITTIAASLSFFCLLCSSPSASAQTPPVLRLNVSDDEKHFCYSISEKSKVGSYVSPTGLRGRIIANSINSDTFPLPTGKKMRFWVKGDEQKSELSTYREIPIRSSSQNAFDIPSHRSLERWPEKAATVTSVSPFPIHLMNQHSPEKLMVTIHGENFVPERQGTILVWQFCRQ